MKVTINLATRPYIELRPLYNLLRTWTLILLLLGGALGLLYRHERARANDASARVANVENGVQMLEQRHENYQILMRQPKDAAILKQSDFLNGLFRRKAFSWTATMTDLETVLPPGVQVLSIDPIVAEDGHVTIRLRVTGQRNREVDLIRNLEQSRHFVAPRLASESLATGPAGAQASLQTVSTGEDVEFDILADYRPLPLLTQVGQNDKRSQEAPNTESAAPEPERRPEHRQLRKPEHSVHGKKATP